MEIHTSETKSANMLYTQQPVSNSVNQGRCSEWDREIQDGNSESPDFATESGTFITTQHWLVDGYVIAIQ